MDSTSPPTAEEAARQFSSQLAAFIRRRVRNPQEAEDLLQDVLLKAIKHQNKLAAANNPLAWLYTVTRTTIADYYRRSGRPLPEEAQWLADTEQAEIGKLSPCIEPLLAQLPEKYGETIRRCDLNGEALTHLAQEKGLSDSALKSRAQRGREMLKRAMLASCRVETDRHGKLVSIDTPESKCC